MLLFRSRAVEFGPDRICKFWECGAPSSLWRRSASWTGRKSVPAEVSRGCLMSFLPYIMRWGSVSSEQIVRWSLLMSRPWSIFHGPRMLGTFSTDGVRRGLALLRSCSTFERFYILKCLPVSILPYCSKYLIQNSDQWALLLHFLSW